MAERPDSFSLSEPIALVGAGRMGGAMLKAWLHSGLAPEKIFVVDPGPPSETLALRDQYGFSLSVDPEAVTTVPGVLVIAVKPQQMDDVLPGLIHLMGGETVAMSIAAGRTIDSIASHLGADRAIIRAMPNTPAAIGRGMTAVCANAHVGPEQARVCTELLRAVGEVAWLDDEGLMDAVTAVSGSGPAYVFLLTECLADAGVEAGLPRDLAEQLARVTVQGGGALMEASDETAGKLRENVTSPGGTTEAALSELMGEPGLRELMARAVAAAVRRSKELSG
ncbi:MAG: pyrroline-5-carboxylate reductase [Dichotomicrobium sp.]